MGPRRCREEGGFNLQPNYASYPYKKLAIFKVFSKRLIYRGLRGRFFSSLATKTRSVESLFCKCLIYMGLRGPIKPLFLCGFIRF